MTIKPILKAAMGLMLAYGSLAQAQVAGKVLVAVGDVSAVRNERTVTLKTGDEVRTGDTLRVGEASNMQVRFTDDGLVALKPNTIFRIDDYKFEHQAEKDTSVFSLVKGGMRTITGLIGKLSRNNYAVKTPTSTIGVRGTFYLVEFCNNSCFFPNGAPVPNGTYGGVTDGRIVNINQAGEREFGKNEFFYVASSNSLPTLLLAPPNFLRDRLDGAKAGSDKSKASTTASTADMGGSNSTPSSTTTATSPPIVVVPTVTAYVPSEQPSIAPGGVPATFQYAVAGAKSGNNSSSGAYSESSGGEQAIVTFSGLTIDQVKSELLTAQSDPNIGHYGLLTAILGGLTNPATILKNAWGYTATYTDTNGYLVTETFNKQAAVDVNANAAAGNVTWGRYYYTDQEVRSTYTYTDSAWEHLAVGDPVINMPTSGTFQFNWVGGTSPTDSAGNVGTLTSGGAWSVSFTSTNPTIQSASPVTWSVNGANYTLNVSSPQTITISNSTISSPISATTKGYSDISISPSCTGSCSSTGSGYMTPAFTGNQAQGLALGIHTYGFSGTNPTASVQVYKR